MPPFPRNECRSASLREILRHQKLKRMCACKCPCPNGKKPKRHRKKKLQKCAPFKHGISQRLEQMALPRIIHAEHTLRRYGYMLYPERVINMCKLVRELRAPQPKPINYWKIMQNKRRRKRRRKPRNKKVKKMSDEWLRKQCKTSSEFFRWYLCGLRDYILSYSQLQVSGKLYKYLEFRKIRTHNKYVQLELKKMCDRLALIIDAKLQPYKQTLKMDTLSVTSLEDKHVVFRMFDFEYESETEVETVYEEESRIGSSLYEFPYGEEEREFEELQESIEKMIRGMEGEEGEGGEGGVGAGEGEEGEGEGGVGAGEGEGEGEGGLGEGEGEEGEGGEGKGKGAEGLEGEEGEGEGEGEGAFGEGAAAKGFEGEGEGEGEGEEGEGLEGAEGEGILGEGGEGEGEGPEIIGIGAEGEGAEGAEGHEGEGEGEGLEGEGEGAEGIEGMGEGPEGAEGIKGVPSKRGVEGEVEVEGEGEGEGEEGVSGAYPGTEEGMTMKVLRALSEEESIMEAAELGEEEEGEEGRHPPGTSSYVDWCLYVSWLKEFGTNIETYASCLQRFRCVIERNEADKNSALFQYLLNNWSQYLADSRRVDTEMTDYFKDKPMTWCNKCADCSIDDYPYDHYVPPELEAAIRNTREWRKLLAEADKYCKQLCADEGAEGEGEEEEDEVELYEIVDVDSSSSSSFDIQQLDPPPRMEAAKGKPNPKKR